MTHHDTAATRRNQDTSEVVFVAALPEGAGADRRRKGRGADIAVQLVSRSGEWARVGVKASLSAASTMAVQIRKGRAGFTTDTPGHFEALISPTDTGAEVYARFVPATE